MDGRGLECARGKVIGGSSSINAMAYVRGHRGDYDRWAATGLGRLVLCACAALFPAPGSLGGRRQRLSRRRRPADDARSRFADPLVRGLRRRRARPPAIRRPRITTARNRKASAAGSTTIRDGRRCSAAVAYLRPALARPNLEVETGALATRIVLERGRAVGVEYLPRRRADHRARRARGAPRRRRDQFAAAADAVRHRRPRRDCAAHGITPRWRCRGVGRNLQDHISARSRAARKAPGPLHAAMRLDRIAVALGQAYLFGTGHRQRDARRRDGLPEEPARRGAARHAAAVCRARR